MDSIRHIQSKGIYHGLPVFPSDLKDLNVIVTGANGISGDYMLRVMSESPARWANIYALSRRPPPDASRFGSNIHFLAIDFLKSPEEIAGILEENGVKADYILFFSYIQPPPLEGERLWTDLEKMSKINGQLLSNFLGALTLASIQPKRFLLQTGAKNYGLHLGPAPTPQYEDAARVTLETNFYYHQEDLLYDYCRQTSCTWNVVRPAAIVGAVRDTAMDIMYPLAVYASVQRHLGEKLVFPADHRAWEKEQTKSSAMMNSYLSEWAVLSSAAADQAFNATDGGPFAWGHFWPQLAKLYGIEYTVPEPDQSKYQEIRLRHETPPRGFGPPATIRVLYTFTQWGKRPEVHRAWKELMVQHNLIRDPFEDSEEFFGFPDLSVICSWPTAMSPTRARKLGFFGYVEPCEPMIEALEELTQMKMGPPLRL